MQKTEKAILLSYLIPLESITQSDVVEALLEGLLTHISSSFQSKMTLLSVGIDALVQVLAKTPIVDAISNLASSILLSLVSEG
jgi:hypothetical protein